MTEEENRSPESQQAEPTQPAANLISSQDWPTWPGDPEWKAHLVRTGLVIIDGAS